MSRPSSVYPPAITPSCKDLDFFHVELPRILHLCDAPLHRILTTLPMFHRILTYLPAPAPYGEMSGVRWTLSAACLLLLSLGACEAHTAAGSVSMTRPWAGVSGGWLSQKSIESEDVYRSGLMRLRGGALFASSLTRWQHADASITEVRKRSFFCFRWTRWGGCHFPLVPWGETTLVDV
jgi:hypothetical protein